LPPGGRVRGGVEKASEGGLEGRGVLGVVHYSSSPFVVGFEFFISCHQAVTRNRERSLNSLLSGDFTDNPLPLVGRQLREEVKNLLVYLAYALVGVLKLLNPCCECGHVGLRWGPLAPFFGAGLLTYGVRRP